MYVLCQKIFHLKKVEICQKCLNKRENKEQNQEDVFR